MSKRLQEMALKIAREIAKSELLHDISFGEEDDKNFNEVIINLTSASHDLWQKGRYDHYMDAAYHVIDQYIENRKKGFGNQTI